MTTIVVRDKRLTQTHAFFFFNYHLYELKKERKKEIIYLLNKCLSIVCFVQMNVFVCIVNIHIL